MNQGNKGTAVNKAAGPEEQAVIANIASLIQELQGMGATGINTPQQEPDGDEMLKAGMMAPPVQKGSEQARTEQPQSQMDPSAPPKDKGMADWKENDEVKKAFATIAKGMMSSQTDGPAANEDGEKRVEDLPAIDEKNINEVAKALMRALGGGKAVAKSQSYQPQTNILEPLLTVMKSMQARIDQQGAILGEVMEGLGLSAAVQQAPTSVNKSQNAPYSGAQGNEMVDMIAMSVAKSLQMLNGGYQQSNSGIPVAKGFEPRCDDDNALGQVAVDFWGRPQIQ